MTRWLWLAGAVLLAVAAAATWFAFQRPDFVGGLIVLAIASVAKAIAPAFKGRPRTKAERDRLNQGDEAFDTRPSGGHGKGG